MSYQVRLSFSVVWIIAFPWASVIDAQTPSRTGPEFEDGPIQLVSEPMQDVIKIHWDGRKLSLGRDWRDPHAGKSDDERREAAIKAQLDRGLPREVAERLADLYQSTTKGDPLKIVFASLRWNATAGSFGCSGTGDRMRLTFHGPKLSGLAVFTGERLRVQFDENETPGRRITIVDNPDGLFSFAFTGDDFLIDLRQKEDGNVRVVRIGETIQVFAADDFVALAEKYPDETHEWLVPLFQHIGIAGPFFKNSAEVRAAVISQLVAMRDTAKLERLLQDLDSDNFEKREKATQILSESFDLWGAAIRSYRDTVDSISREARKRLDVIIENARESEISKFIKMDKLLDSPEYLIGLLSDAPDTMPITDRLETITNKSFGGDPTAWQRWLEEKSASEE